jgi:hypothetical protein
MSLRYPTSVKSAATPARTNAMGYPENRNPMNVKNMKMTKM